MSDAINKDMPVKQTSSFTMMATLGLVAMMSGILVVLTWQLTLEPIKENKRIMIEKAIFHVVPGASSRQSYALTDAGLTTDLKAKSSKKAMKFFAAFDTQGQLKGLAIESAAQGYADMVTLLYGYDANCQCVTGFSIIKMAETPGLGDKILTDKNFLANFAALDAKVNSDNTDLQHPIVSVKHGTKSNPWEVDSISGATITSKAVANAINISARSILPKLQPYLSQLKTSQLKASHLKLEEEK